MRSKDYDCVIIGSLGFVFFRGSLFHIAFVGSTQEGKTKKKEAGNASTRSAHLGAI